MSTSRRYERYRPTATPQVKDLDRVMEPHRARARTREQRYAARQTHERASVTVDRLQRRVGELSERLDRMQPLLCLGVSSARVSL